MTRLLLWYPPAWRARYGDGLQWAMPDNRGITQALDLMSLALLTFCVCGLWPRRADQGWHRDRRPAPFRERLARDRRSPAPDAGPRGLVTGMAQLIRRIDRSPRALCFETWLGRVAGGGMLIFLCGVLRWLSSAEAGQRPGVGTIDVAGLATRQ